MDDSIRNGERPAQLREARKGSAAGTGRPAGAYVLMLLHVLLAVGALFGGAALIADPSGGLLEMPVALLTGSPFPDYLVPGVILFALFGVAPLAVILGLWLRPAWLELPRGLPSLAWFASGTLGLALIVWILVQMTILRFFLQPVLLVQGAAIIGLGLLPGVRRHYSSVPHSRLRRTLADPP